MFRVFDNVKKVWATVRYDKKIFLSIFSRLIQTYDDRYIAHRDIGLSDKNDKLIFEGDICKIELKDNEKQTTEVIGLICYEPTHAAFYLFDFKNSQYYTLGVDKCKQMIVIGNVCENRDLFPTDI